MTNINGAQLTQRVILITGGSSGIGLGLALRLSDRGNTVVVSGRDAVKLGEIKRQHPQLHTIQGDVSSAAGVTALVDQVISQFPLLDVVFNNAGIMKNIDLNSSGNIEELCQEIDTNLSGSIRMVGELLPHLKRRPAAMIVNVSGALAFVPMFSSPVYCATKAAIHSFSLSLREQLRDSSVRVVELVPPGTNTPLLHGVMGAEASAQHGMAVDRLVTHSIAGIESGRTEIRPGLSNVLYIMSRVAPGFMFRQLTNMVRKGFR